MSEEERILAAMPPHKYVGFDLDRTIARYDGWVDADHVGEPIDGMTRRIRRLRDAGIDVRLFTARASRPERIPAVQRWSMEHLGEVLPVTCTKDDMLGALFDDIAIQVIPNTGRTLEEILEERILGRLIAEGWTPPAKRCA